MTAMKTPRLTDGGRDVEGNVKFPSDWDGRAWIERADLLKDWVNILTHKYNETLQEKLNGHCSIPSHLQ